MKSGLQLGLPLCALLWTFVSAQDPTVSLAGVQDLSEYFLIAVESCAANGHV